MRFDNLDKSLKTYEYGVINLANIKYKSLKVTYTFLELL